MVNKSTALVPVNAVAELNNDQCETLLTYGRNAHSLLISQLSLRSSMEEVDRLYMREKDYTVEEWEARLQNLRGDARKLRDITVPIVMPQVESALAYYANVFCTGYPIFGVSSDPTNEDAATMMETIMAENAITAGWIPQMMMFFRDGLKYNIHAMETEWARKTIRAVVNDPNKPNGAAVKQTLWHGNRLNRMDMYNTIFDPRVPISQVHNRGEFAGYMTLHSRIDLMQFIQDMEIPPPQSVIDKALNSTSPTASWSGGSPFSYYIPIINPTPMMSYQSSGMFDWVNWANNLNQTPGFPRYAGVYERMRLYVKMIPKEFGFEFPGNNMPVIAKIEMINGQVILSVEFQSNAHGFLPIVFGQPIEDGLYLQTKSFAQNVGDFQDVASALMNGYIATQRRSVGDRIVYNPMLITKKNISSTDPAAKIPVQPAAFGRPISDAFSVLPFRDEQSPTLLQGVDRATNWANLTNGQNPVAQGQFVPGNKTQSEFDTTQGHSSDRNKLMALLTEGVIFTPIKEIMKLNILQYQQDGQIYSDNLKKEVNIDMTSLRQTSVMFKVSDGELPKSTQMSEDMWNVAMQTIASNPGFGQDYNSSDVFAYMFEMQGVDLKPFAKSQLQRAYDQQVQAWQQVAMEAAKAGQQPPPQPQMPQELIQELQVKHNNGGVLPGSSIPAQALLTTVGTPNNPLVDNQGNANAITAQ